MEINKLSKIKMALRIALPCLALSVIMSACSNDDMAEDVIVDNNISNGLTFEASLPSLEETPSTRIGIDETLLTTNPNITEPLIWVVGDKLSFIFVKEGEGPVGQVVEYAVTSVGNRNRSCSMSPVTPTTINGGDGTYNVYVVTPSSENNFFSGLSSFCNINLSGQSQPATVNNYRNLSDFLYLYASTTVRVEGGGITSGGSLSFAIATSLLRFNVKNVTGSDATIDKITISHSGSSEHQFYSNRVFNPTTGAFTGGTRVSSLELDTEKTLSNDGNFDAYLSIFPTEGFADAADNKIAIRVDYIANGAPKHKDFEWPVSAFSSNPPHAVFRSSGRFLFNLTLDEGEESNDGEHKCNIDTHEYAAYSFHDGSSTITWMVSPLLDINGEVVYDTHVRNCPDGWRGPMLADLENLYKEIETHGLRNYFLTHMPSVLLYWGNNPNPETITQPCLIGNTRFSHIGNLRVNSIIFHQDGTTTLDTMPSLIGTNEIHAFRYPVRCIR